MLFRSWPDLKARVAELIRTRTRDEWCSLLEGTDVCFAPVLEMHEAHTHPHNVERDTFVSRDGVVQPNAAPRFSRTPSAVRSDPAAVGQHTREVLEEWGVAPSRIDSLFDAKALA